MKPENVEAFKVRFEEVVRATLRPEQRVPEEEVDLEIGLEAIDKRFFGALHGMEPFGPLNMKPVFLTRGLLARNIRLLGSDSKHLKFTAHVPQHPRIGLDAIAFNQARHHDLVNTGEPFSMLYTIEENHWNGTVRLQLNVKDIKPGVEVLWSDAAPDALETAEA
jgi:single-stranded-DNA-specific exonuclease